MNVKTVMLMVDNPSLIKVGKSISSKYFDYIEVQKCIDNGMINLYESEPHITLLYGFEPMIGENTMYHILKIQNRELYRQLRSNTKLTLPEVVIDTFDNPDSRVLKINTNNSNIFSILNGYYQNLITYPNTRTKSDDGQFHSHLTLTYLKPDTPDSIIQEIKETYESEIIPYMELKCFWLSSDTKERKLIDIKLT